MDGVVLKRSGTPKWVYEKAAKKTLDEEGKKFEMKVVREMGNFHWSEKMILTCESIGLSFPKFWKKREKYAAKIERIEMSKGRIELREGVMNKKKVGYNSVAIVSNNRVRTVKDVVNKFELDFVDLCIGRPMSLDGYKCRKPSPYLINLAKEKLSFSNGIYVGDKESDIVASMRANMDSALLCRNKKDIETTVNPTYKIKSLRELAALDKKDG
jgi:phosphoglycolate phosphatase-like HAD superfamily hydrolase